MTIASTTPGYASGATIEGLPGKTQIVGNRSPYHSYADWFSSVVTFGSESERRVSGKMRFLPRLKPWLSTLQDDVSI